METSLQTPNPPVNMLSGYVSQHQTTFTVCCHDSTFKNVTASDSAGNPLFRVEGSAFGTSWSWRRKNGWVVESPDGGQLCSLQHKAQVTRDHSAVDVTVRTEAGEDVLAVMRPNGHAAITVTVSVGDTIIATVHKVEDNSPGMRGDRERSVWEARVAAGVDLSFIMVMVLCRAEMGHVWKQ
ncbi:hypothetical protein F4820DRAFT_444557 [Hypoxylon rubiginosum]|uniref:Uncharacterized protein n=1 Tax=Hypoxylon rubiginosum TaxID=110542 RepID=A0ACB9ZAY3_9PEZI|nr:hypothetical protein F4820DRAFT_444557 [Hypoxylon rubiginosum]